MQRIPFPDMEKVPAHRLEKVGYPEKNPLNITKVALHLPDVIWDTHFALKTACVRSTTMDPWLREVLIMRVAFNAESEYEIHHHMSISANLGFTPEQQEAIRDQDYDKLTEAERVVARFTDEVISMHPSDEAVLAAREMFGDAGVLEMVVLIYSYWATAMMLAVTNIPPDDEPVKSWDEPAAEE